MMTGPPHPRTALDAVQNQITARIQDSALPQGGFTIGAGRPYRPDATAWAILILDNLGTDHAALDLARSRLAADQLEDGRISISPEHPDAIWPTPLALMAWIRSPSHRQATERATQFLLQTSGTSWAKTDGDTVIGHDPSIRGWPWIAHTHSWVHPTALAMIALQTVGLTHHERVLEGERLLLNRQLPHGGWNYGNTTVWGQELQPFPETTGAALNALATRVPYSTIRHSAEYLEHTLHTAHTPQALGWGLLGLQSWGKRPSEAEQWILQCMKRERRYGGYDTVDLCLLLATLLATKGLESLASSKKRTEAAA